MFISYNEACARDCSTLEQDLVLCEKAGFDYIEIRLDMLTDYLKRHTVEELAAFFCTSRLKPHAFNEALDPSAFLQALLPLRKKRMDASNRCTTLVHIANGYLYGGQPQQALAVLEDVQPPEKALEMRGLVAGNKATCFLAAGEMDRAQTAMDELRRIAADRSCKKEFVQKARHTLGYLRLCMDIARGRHADVGALQKDFESSRAPLHRLDVQYRIALALRHRGDRTGMEKSREYLLENSGGTCYGELARAL